MHSQKSLTPPKKQEIKPLTMDGSSKASPPVFCPDAFAAKPLSADEEEEEEKVASLTMNALKAILPTHASEAGGSLRHA